VCYRVTATSPDGSSAPSNVDCTTPPAAPANLAAASPSQGIIDLTWADRSGAEDGYEVQRSAATIAWTAIANLPANAVSYRDTRVALDIQYSYRVRAKKDGGFSDFSAVAIAVTVATPPATPSGVTAIPVTSTEIDISWPDNSTNEEGYRVERSPDGQTGWVAVGISGPGDEYNPTLTVYDRDRITEQRMCYRVFAYNAKGSSDASNVACATPPAAPTDLVASTASNHAIDLHWVNHSTVAEGYAVQLVYQDYYYGEYYQTLATLGPDATSYHDGGHNSGEYYTYRVLALKDGGQSDPSNYASAWTDFPPSAPTGLTATPGTVGRIALAWSNSSGAGEYLIERCPGAAGACGDGSFEQIASIDGSNLNYTDASVQSGNTYTYRVRAFRSGQSSEPSNKASATAP
jgi:titin